MNPHLLTRSPPTRIASPGGHNLCSMVILTFIIRPISCSTGAVGQQQTAAANLTRSFEWQ